jgi:hypothetical protein
VVRLAQVLPQKQRLRLRDWSMNRRAHFGRVFRAAYGIPRGNTGSGPPSPAAPFLEDALKALAAGPGVAVGARPTCDRGYLVVLGVPGAGWSAGPPRSGVIEKRVGTDC